MFALHETTQRRVCRTAFVVGCVLPTLSVILWIAFLHRPWRENDWQRVLRQQMHVRATIGEIHSPYPGVTQLLEVQFADLRTERPLGSIDELRIEGWKSLLVADRIEIAAAQFPAFASAIATWISAEGAPALQLQAETLRFVGPDGESFELKNVRMQSLTGNAQKRIKLQAEPLDAEQGGTIELVVEHHAGQAESMVFASLDTQKERLPAWIFADWVPGMKRCSEAQFTGLLQIESLAQQLSGTMSGQLEAIDLGQWIDLAGPHRIEAVATMHLEDLQWRGRRIEVAQGKLQAGAGKASRSLLDELTKRLFCVPGESLAPTKESSSGELLSFDELAFDFRINSTGMTISGACKTSDNHATGCLFANNGKPLLLQPGYTDLPVAQLVQALMPPAASWLPATREANAMADGLPLPSISTPTSPKSR